MTWPNQPEYLQFFSNEGSVTVQVRFSSKNDSHRSITKMNMHWGELDRLIDSETGSPYQYMYLDTFFAKSHATRSTRKRINLQL